MIFFFQAEDGIRYADVTGVQTCALPILKKSIRKIDGSICEPRGFKAAAVFCDIKRIDTGKGSEKGQKRDLALIVSDVPAAEIGRASCRERVCFPGRAGA